MREYRPELSRQEIAELEKEIAALKSKNYDKYHRYTVIHHSNIAYERARHKEALEKRLYNPVRVKTDKTTWPTLQDTLDQIGHDFGGK